MMTQKIAANISEKGTMNMHLIYGAESYHLYIAQHIFV